MIQIPAFAPAAVLVSEMLERLTIRRMDTQLIASLALRVPREMLVAVLAAQPVRVAYMLAALSQLC